MTRRVARFVLPVLAALTFAVCGCNRNGMSMFIETIEDLKGLRCGVILGSVFQDAIERLQPDLEFHSFNNTPSAVDALRIGKVDVVPIDGVIGRQLAARYPKDFRVAFLFGDNPYGYFYRKGSPLKAKIDSVIRRMKESGEIARLVAKWCDAPDLDKVAPEEYAELKKTFTGRNGSLRVSTYPGYAPGIFLRADGIVGFEKDILQRIALELDRKLEFVSVEMNAIITTVESDRADMGGGCVSITAERAERVDFSIPFLNAEFAAVVRQVAQNVAGSAVGEPKGSDDKSFLVSLKESFVRTFVTEERWRMMATGLGSTLIITVLAAIFATLLAFPVWKARTARCALVSGCAKAYITILQGTPVLVLLMVLFYLVFGSVDIDGLWVAVVGFTLNGSAYVGEALRSGVDSVPRGQTEAALALGYGPRKAFVRFILPQAARTVLPVYRGILINLLKNTSVVGYIAINDLTKASDLVRSRTYESFFPILTTAFVYFVAAWVLAKVLDRLGRRLDPAFRRLRG